MVLFVVIFLSLIHSFLPYMNLNLPSPVKARGSLLMKGFQGWQLVEKAYLQVVSQSEQDWSQSWVERGARRSQLIRSLNETKLRIQSKRSSNWRGRKIPPWEELRRWAYTDPWDKWCCVGSLGGLAAFSRTVHVNYSATEIIVNKSFLFPDTRRKVQLFILTSICMELSFCLLREK